MKKILIAFAALAALGAAESALAQGANTRRRHGAAHQPDPDRQARDRAVDAAAHRRRRSQAFTPIYDQYQRRDEGPVRSAGRRIIEKFAANYGSMTDDAAKDIMKDFFKVRDDRNAIVEKYAKKFAEGAADHQGAAVGAGREQAERAARRGGRGRRADLPLRYLTPCSH